MPDRHLADLRGNREPGRDHPRGGSDRGDRVRPRRPGRPGQHRIRRQRPTPPSEHRADRLDPGCEAPQPAAHRRRRPVQPGRDPAVPQPNGLRRERRPDHRRGVRAPDQHQHRKQHIRQPVHRDRRGTIRTGLPGPRTVRARAQPHPVSAPTHPGHANPPERSRSSTAPASISTVSIAPPSATTRPSRTLPAKDNSGRAVAYPDPKIVTVAAPTNTVDTTRPDPTGSTRSTARTSPYVVILGGA